MEGDPDDDLEEKDGDKYAQIDELLRGVPNDVADAFEAVICDEAHMIRNPIGLQSRAVSALDGYRYSERPQGLAPAPFFVLVTGTPMCNKAADLGRMITNFYRDEWATPDGGSLSLEDYERLNTDLKQLGTEVSTAISWPTPNLMQFVKVLHSPSFKSYASPGGGKQMASSDGAVVIPPVLRMIQLRRITSDHHEDQHGESTLIGTATAAFMSISVELVMSVKQARAHHARYLAVLKEGIGTGPSKINPKEPMVNQGVLRRPRHIALTPFLEDAINRVPLNAADVSKAHNDFADHGATLFQLATDLVTQEP